MNFIKIRASELSDCIENSFGKSNYDVGVDDNTLLANERNEYLKTGPSIWPSLIINGIIYDDILDP